MTEEYTHGAVHFFYSAQKKAIYAHTGPAGGDTTYEYRGPHEEETDMTVFRKKRSNAKSLMDMDMTYLGMVTKEEPKLVLESGTFKHVRGGRYRHRVDYEPVVGEPLNMNVKVWERDDGPFYLAEPVYLNK